MTRPDTTTDTPVAAFDFDGTLIAGDSLYRFLRKTLAGPAIAAGLVRGVGAARMDRRLDRGGLKERILGACYRGWSEHQLRRAGEQFAAELLASDAPREDVFATFDRHVADGHRVVIVSASIDCYLDPIADALGVEVACTRLHFDDGRFTGRFDGPNCRGDEKVLRLQALGVDGRHLTAYGDSSGDDAMLRFAATPHRVGPRR